MSEEEGHIDKVIMIDERGRKFIRDEDVPWVPVDRKWFAYHPSRFWYVREPLLNEINVMVNAGVGHQADIIRGFVERIGTTPRILILVVKHDSDVFEGRSRWPIPTNENVKPESIIDPQVLMPDGGLLEPKQVQKMLERKLLVNAAVASIRKSANPHKKRQPRQPRHEINE
jgi:hypothetical protein